MSGPRVALVHDWLTGMRGGEKCLEALLAIFPQADIHTLLHIPGSVSRCIESRPIRTSFIGRLPGAERHYRHYLPLFPRAVESLDLSGYDLVVSLSHCVAKGVLVPRSACHVCYCFTPMRYAWDQYHSYLARMNWPTRTGMRLFMGYLRAWDRATAGRPDSFLTISRFVADRIRRYYDREAEVIYPPVETDFFTPPAAPSEGSRYLVVSALVPYKCLDLVVRAAPHLPHPVLIIGSGPEEARLRGLDRGNVEFAGWRSREELRDAYRDCRALLFPGEEDFGLTPVEAMACGRPVIGYARGGLSESVVPPGNPGGAPATGILFDGQDVDSLVAAVRRFEESPRLVDPGACRRRALDFAPGIFEARMRAAIGRIWREKSGSDGPAGFLV
jgi:glycosyltransferase involved in cell wall biosynthesis